MSLQDRTVIVDHGLRYDITVIPPRMLGSEYVKDKGTFRPGDRRYGHVVPGSLRDHPRHRPLPAPAVRRRQGRRVVLIEARDGDKVIIPPNYGHVTINPSGEELKMANWVSRNFSSDYGPYQKCGGAAYYELVGGKMARNGRCDHAPEIRYLKPATS